MLLYKSCPFEIIFDRIASHGGRLTRPFLSIATVSQGLLTSQIYVKYDRYSEYAIENRTRRH